MIQHLPAQPPSESEPERPSIIYSLYFLLGKMSLHQCTWCLAFTLYASILNPISMIFFHQHSDKSEQESSWVQGFISDEHLLLLPLHFAFFCKWVILLLFHKQIKTNPAFTFLQMIHVLL